MPRAALTPTMIAPLCGYASNALRRAGGQQKQTPKDGRPLVTSATGVKRLQYAILIAAALYSGTEPGRLDEVSW